MNKYAVVLAAGKGTRMKSSLHKVLHQVLGKSMVDHAVTNLEKIGVDKIVTVIGYEAESVRAELQDRVEYAMQTEQLGTGHAVMMTKGFIRRIRWGNDRDLRRCPTFNRTDDLLIYLTIINHKKLRLPF